MAAHQEGDLIERLTSLVVVARTALSSAARTGEATHANGSSQSTTLALGQFYPSISNGRQAIPPLTLTNPTAPGDSHRPNQNFKPGVTCKPKKGKGMKHVKNDGLKKKVDVNATTLKDVFFIDNPHENHVPRQGDRDTV